jgi:hypothetical protein
LLTVHPGSRSTASGVGTPEGSGVGRGDGNDGCGEGAIEHLLEATSAQHRTDAVSGDATAAAPATQTAAPEPSPLIV